jgi:hypothetical protein
MFVTWGFFEKIVEGFCGKTSGQPPYSKGGVRVKPGVKINNSFFLE